MSKISMVAESTFEDSIDEEIAALEEISGGIEEGGSGGENDLLNTAIRADAPDEEGFSQLYKYNPDTETRTNVVPKVDFTSLFGTPLLPSMNPAVGDDIIIGTTDGSPTGPLAPIALNKLGFKYKFYNSNYIALYIRADKIKGFDDTVTWNLTYAKQLYTEHIIAITETTIKYNTETITEPYISFESAATVDGIKYIKIKLLPYKSYPIWIAFITL